MPRAAEWRSAGCPMPPAPAMGTLGGNSLSWPWPPTSFNGTRREQRSIRSRLDSMSDSWTLVRCSRLFPAHAGRPPTRFCLDAESIVFAGFMM